MKYKIGDRVIKARPYSTTEYCVEGGDSTDVPIGTIGTIIDIGRRRVKVKFDNDFIWTLNDSELDLVKITNWREKIQ